MLPYIAYMDPMGYRATLVQHLIDKITPPLTIAKRVYKSNKFQQLRFMVLMTTVNWVKLNQFSYRERWSAGTQVYWKTV